MSSLRFLGALAFAFSLSLPTFDSDARLSAQERSGQWVLNLQLAGLGPRAENDRWYVTEEGYHVHPFSDAFTPGVQLGLAYQATSVFRAGINLLYGRAPVTLGMIDQNSTRELEVEEPMGFMGLLFSPLLTIPGDGDWTFVLGPSVGFGWMQEVAVDSPFGPTVTYGGSTEIVLGGQVGFDVRLGESPFSFSGRFMALNMDLPLHEDGLGQEMSKPFGPMGLLAGVSYTSHR